MKARDIIPGWPRGRSTSRSFWFEQRWRVLIGIAPYDTARLAEDRAEDKAEERRKADMMEAWYIQKRIEARGKLYPQPECEKELLRFVVRPNSRISREIVTYLQMFKEQMERCLGSGLIGEIKRVPYPWEEHPESVTGQMEGLGCGCCPGGKHQW